MYKEINNMSNIIRELIFRLSEINGWKVLLIEAGGEEPLESSVPAFRDYGIGSRIDWNYTTQPQPGNCGGKGCSWPRGKTLGGTSVLNWMIYDRGNKHNYEDWRNQGDFLKLKFNNLTNYWII